MPEIQLIHDNTIDIAFGKSRHEKSWKTKPTLWSAFVSRVSTTHRTAEKYNDYITALPARQDEIKDIGGFVGGRITGGRRNRTSIAYRQLVTLDIDHCGPGVWDEFTMLYGNAACCYSTHKHTPAAPRLRLIMPLDREVGPDEYQAIARKIAGVVGIEVFDHTTFEPSRLMYWPSTASDAEYCFEYQDGPWICADDVLGSYYDWKDSSEWPVSERFKSAVQRNIAKQGDPLEKEGVIGAFCRTHSISSVIDHYLSDVYSATDVEDRYTYVNGSTSGGLVVYEDKYAFSHHGTDPCSMKLCNAFDLVRIHKYGLRDEDCRTDTPVNKKPSYLSMVELATKDKAVKRVLGAERMAQVAEDFGGFYSEPPKSDFTDDDTQEQESTDAPEPVVAEEVSDEWLEHMEIDKKGNYLSTLDNMVLVMSNDPQLKGNIRFNAFEQREAVVGDLPWRKKLRGADYLTDKDTSNLKHYFERVYKIATGTKLEDVIRIIMEKTQFHPVKDYLNKQKWDGVRRIDTLLVDYLGAEDNLYTRAVTRKTLAAAVTRIMRPGCKFDYVLTLIGKQGLKKSMLADKLGGEWFSDSFTTMHGKESFEQLQGAWIVEMAELAAMRRAEIETAKHFIAKRKDRYRVSYGRRVEEFPRQCIFMATTNDMTPLKDSTGGRRWWVVEVHVQAPKYDVSSLTPAVVAQIWAEAVQLYKKDEPLYLTPEMEAIAAKVQSHYTEVDERSGMIRKYLDTLLPGNWEQMELFDRRAWLSSDGNEDALQPVGQHKRQKVCIAEIWCEVLRGKREEMDLRRGQELRNIMNTMPGWEPCKHRLNFGEYGSLKGYIRTGAAAVSGTGELLLTEEFER